MFLDSYAYPISIICLCLIIRDILDSLLGIAHRHPDTRFLDHFDIVQAVSDCHDFIHRYANLIAQEPKGLRFADTFRIHFHIGRQ